jgi:4-amino-4-deoxy-L-arabinose transferase-like glycosyltransferase
MVWIGLFSLASTKLPSYVTPCYPALALLTGLFIDRWTRGRSTVPIIWPRLAVGVLAAVGIAIVAILPFVARHYLPGDEWLAAIGLFPLGGAAAAAFALRRNDREGVVTSVAMAASLLSLGLFGVIAQQVDSHQQSNQLLRLVSEHGDTAKLAAYGCLEPSWIFYSGKQVQDLGPATAAERDRRVQAFLSENEDHFLITTRSRLPEISDQIPPGAAVLAEVPYFLKREQLVIVGRRTDVQTASRK